MKHLLRVCALVCFAASGWAQITCVPACGGGGGGGGGGAIIPSVTNLINGDGAGNGADSGIAKTSIPTSLTGDATGSVVANAIATTVGKLNGVSLAGIASGLLFNTTGTGLPSIASAAQILTACTGCAPIASPTFTGTVTVPNGGILGTPTSMTATNVTGLPINTGVTGLGAGIGTFLGTPSGANLASALTTALPASKVGILAGTTVPGTSVTLSGNSQIFICTSTCTITVPVPSLNVQYCVMNDDNTSTVISLSAIGSSARYENTARTAYGTASTGTLVSGGATGDAVCIVGRDSTHYLTVAHTGTWTAN